MKYKKMTKFVSAALLSQMLCSTTLSVVADETITSTSEVSEEQTATETTDDNGSMTNNEEIDSSGDNQNIDTDESTTDNTNVEDETTESSDSQSENSHSDEQSDNQSSSESSEEKGDNENDSTETSEEEPHYTQSETVQNENNNETKPVEESNSSQIYNEQTEDAIRYEKNDAVEQFVNTIGEPAREVAKKNNLYASVMIAQAILESGSGQSELAQAPYYNIFGIKGTFNGEYIFMNTQEDNGNGILYTVKQPFKKYKNYKESLEDYARLLKDGVSWDSQFYSGAWKSNASTYKEATKYLKGRYATDTEYDKKLNGLIETYDLTQYDKDTSNPTVKNESYIVPVNNYYISSHFGNRNGEFHRGIDLAASQGEPIYASQEGTVIEAEYHYSWGNYVAIEHDDGTTTLYAHQQNYVVQEGDRVEQGQKIGYVGSTGNSTGPHLHFEICLDNSLSQNKLIDPYTVLFDEKS